MAFFGKIICEKECFSPIVNQQYFVTKTKPCGSIRYSGLIAENVCFATHENDRKYQRFKKKSRKPQSCDSRPCIWWSQTGIFKLTPLSPETVNSQHFSAI